MRADYYGASGSEPAGVSAETGIVFSQSDAQAPSGGTAPITKPAAAGTNWSWIMLLALNVTTSDTTTISNRQAALASAIATGLAVWFAQQPTYRQPASGNKPGDSGSNGATPTPAGTSAPGAYTAMTTTPQTWDSGSDSAGSTGRSGDFIELVLGVSGDYAGGGGQATLPSLLLSYDES